MASRSRRERERVRAEYRRRDAEAPLRSPYRPEEASVRLEAEGLERALASLLSTHGVLPLAGRRILEIGCGAGAQLARFVRLGADAHALWGVDLSSTRLQRARALLGDAHLVEADASELPFPDGVFDLVAQFTTLSSILDPEVRAAAAAEMRRVARPGGALLSYDMRVGSPASATRPIGRRELARLFPGLEFELRSVTLVPIVARLVAPRAPGVATLLARIPALRTHHVAFLRTPDPVSRR